MDKSIVFIPAYKCTMSFFKNKRKSFKRWKLCLSLLFVPVRLPTSKRITFLDIHSVELNSLLRQALHGKRCRTLPSRSSIVLITLHTEVGRGTICAESISQSFIEFMPSRFLLHLLHSSTRQKIKYFWGYIIKGRRTENTPPPTIFPRFFSVEGDLSSHTFSIYVLWASQLKSNGSGELNYKVWVWPQTNSVKSDHG